MSAQSRTITSLTHLSSAPTSENPTDTLSHQLEVPISYFGILARIRSDWSVEKSIYSAEYQRLCAVLRELRLEAGLTQTQVAAELRAPQSFVSMSPANGGWM